MRKLFFAVFLCFTTFISFGQSLDRILLSDYIQHLETTKGLTFSYYPSLIQNIKIDPVNEENTEDIIAALNSTTAFNFEVLESGDAIISPKKKQYNLLTEGIITDTAGLPLIGSVVSIKNQMVATYADQNGTFQLLAKMDPGDSLEIHLMGFESKKIALTEFNDKGKINITLVEGTTDLEEILVTVYTTSGILYNYKDQSIEINPKNAGLLPGETETDILNSIEYLPGINSPNDRAGNLSVRGADPDKTLITFDNIPMYHTGHYFGTFSPYNSQVIESVKILRNGAQGAETGGRVGGRIEISSKKDIPDSSACSLGAATTYLAGSAQLPIVKNKLGVILGARSSYPFAWNSPKINAINEFLFTESKIGASLLGIPDFDLRQYDYSFNDVNAKIIYKPHKNHDVNWSFLRVDNQLYLNTFFFVRDVTFIDTVLLNNWGTNLSINSKWTDKISTTTSFTRASFLQKFTSEDLDTNNVILANSGFFNEINDTKVKSNMNIRFSRNHSLDFGYQMDYSNLTSIATGYSDPGPPQSLDKSGESYLHTAYLKYNMMDYRKPYNLSVGFRASYYTPTAKIYPEPRVLLNVFVNDHLTLKTNYGVYNQFINHIVSSSVSNAGGTGNLNWQLSNNTDVKVTYGQHLMTGAIFSKNNFVVDIEGYYKLIGDVTAYNFVDDDTSKTYIYGGYENFGVDLLVKKTYKNLEGWITYSFGKSNAQFDTLEFTHIWNQKHVFSAVCSYKINKLKFSAGWHYKSGVPALPDIRLGYIGGTKLLPGNNTTSGPPGGPATINYVEGSAEEYLDQFPNNHQLDISVAYSVVPKSKKWLLNIGASIQNVYDNPMVYSQVNRRLLPPNPPGDVLRVNRYGLGFTPSLMVTFKW